MCEPVTIAAVAVGTAALAGGGISAYAQYRNGQSQQTIANNNAKVAEYQAADAIQRGAYQARQIEIEGRQVGSTALAAASTDGVDVNSGSPSNMFITSAANAARDAETAKANAAREAWGYANEAADLRAQGKMAKQAGILGALGTGLSAIGSAGGAYAAGKK